MMTGCYTAIVVILSVAGALEAGDTEIWPIPTECPKVDPLDHTVHLQHENDCTKFYKCDHGEKVLFDCPSSLHFNPVLQVCDWPDQVNCTLGQVNPTTPEPDPPRDPECPFPDPLDRTIHLPHETNCAKFYKCDNGKKVEFDCPDGLHFNKELEVCDWPRDAGCEEGISSVPPTEPVTETPTTAEPEPPNRDPECPWPDPKNHTVHLPHESDCGKFYKCDHGAKVEFDCPDGLHFNKELQVCDWPRDAGCEEISSERPTEPATEAPTTAEPEPPNRDPDCPWPDPKNHTVHLPHETDCSKFYKCDHGAKVEFDCPGGLHFNKELQVCDWPRDAGCEEITTGKPTTKPTDKPTHKPTQPPYKDPDCPWPDPLNDTVHLPHKECTKFYKCDNGVKVEFDCPDNLHFNPVLEVCDWPWDAGCEETTTAEPTTAKPTTAIPTTAEPTTAEPTTAEPTTAEPTASPNRDPDCPWPDPLNDTVHLPHEDCSKFYKCDNGIKVEFDCPANLHFNPILEVCDWPWDAGCEETTTAEPTTAKPTTAIPTTAEPTTAEPTTAEPTTAEPTTAEPTTAEPTTAEPTTAEPTAPPNRDPDCPWPDPLNDTVHLPHEDCSKFYKCDNGIKVEFDCPANLHFNPILEVCDWPWDAGCEETITVEPTTAKPTTAVPTTAEPTTAEPTTAEPTAPPNRDPDCPWPDPLNDTVHLPHEDCSKFYKCDNGVKVEFDCPANLHFNPILEVCDWPSNAGCEETTTAEPTTAKPTTAVPTTAEPTTAEPTPPPNRDPDCPWPDPLNDTVHLPHEDCSKFYKCDNGVKVEFDCPANLHFNPVLEVCDWPWDAGCEEPTTAEPTTVKPTTAVPTTAEPTTAEPTTVKPTTVEPTTAEPTPPPNKDPDCPWPDPLNDTVHLPHEDCTKFYKCDNGVKVEFDCPANLHFNPVLEVCDWPSNAGCEETTTTEPTTAKPTTAEPTTAEPTTVEPTTAEPTPPPNRDPDCPWPDPLNDTVHLPHEDDCTKFYKCDNGVKVEFDCPANLHFNPVLEVCDWPSNAGCEETTTAEPTTAKPTTAEPTTAKPTTVEPTTAEPTPPPNRDPDCPWPDPLNDTVHLPHEDDCTKFYKCDNGVKVEFDCPANLHFNPVLEVCDWPSNAGCEETTTAEPTTAKPTTAEPTTAEPTTAEPTTVEPTTAEPTPPPNRDPDCPWPDPLNDTVHLPHEDDCTKFYKCDNGVKVEFDCPANLHFNPVLEVCDWPSNAGCEETTTAEPTTAKPTTAEPTTAEPTTVEPTTAEPTPPPNRDPNCPWPDPLNDTVHLPHEDDCTKFYKCDNGVKVEFDCPANLHFNPVLEVCDWPSNAGCEETTTAEPTTAKPTTAEPTTTKPTTVEPTTAEPTPPPNRDPDCPWPDPLNDTVHLPHEDDCTKFYKCDNGVKVEFDCPANLHFNPVLEVCDWPSNAGCEETTTAEPTTAKPTTAKPTTAEPTTAEPTTAEPTTVEPTTAEPTPPPNRDPDCPWPDPLNDTVHLPHEDDCTKFYKCDNGVKVEFDCPANLHFNPVLEVCDWPSNAGCEETTTAEATTTESTTTERPNPCPNVKCQDATIYLPVLSNPRKYIRCVHGEEVIEKCPGSLVFDAQLATCNLEHLVET